MVLKHAMDALIDNEPFDEPRQRSRDWMLVKLTFWCPGMLIL
jgi:hypothetical protein